MSIRLRESVRFQARGTTPDGYGNTIDDWANLAPDLVERAAIKPLGGDEAVRAQRVEAKTKFEIMVRANAATLALLAEVNRAVNTRTGETFNIHSIVNPDQRGRYLAMICTTGGADG